MRDDGPGLLRDQYVHLGYEFSLMRPNMRRQGKGELWISFASKSPRIRLQGVASSPRFGEGQITLLIDASTHELYATFKLSALHDSQCLIYPFPNPQEADSRMQRLRWRLKQMRQWQEFSSQHWEPGLEVPILNWTKSYNVDFLLSENSMELTGIDLRHGDRVAKTVRLDTLSKDAAAGPLDAQSVFLPPAGCKPAGQVEDPMAVLQIVPPYQKSSALNDLLLVLADHRSHWPQVFVVLTTIMLPGDVAVLIEDPQPPHLEKLGAVSFDYEADIFQTGIPLAFHANGGKTKTSDRHTSAGSIAVNLQQKQFRLTGEAKSTKVGPLQMDLIARGVEQKLYANINLTAQNEHQCLVYKYPEAPQEKLEELQRLADKGLTFFAIAEADGEDCGIFVAPLTMGRWIHIYVDMESDRPDSILRSEIHKGGQLLRTVDVRRWHAAVDVNAAVQPSAAWGCTEEPSGHEQLARLGLRKAHHWSMELQDALHAVVHMSPSFAILQILALTGDVAVMVHEPAVPKLWKLPEASLRYALTRSPGDAHAEDSKPYDGEPIWGRFAVAGAKGELRLTAVAPGTNLSIAVSEGTISVRLEDHKVPEAPCLGLKLEDHEPCSGDKWGKTCGEAGAGRCAKVGTGDWGYVCKDKHCHADCAALFGNGDGGGCKDPGPTTPDGRRCSSGKEACLVCHRACIASCTDVALPDAWPCVVLVYPEAQFGGEPVTFFQGTYDLGISAGGQGGIPAGALSVSGDGCVATIFPRANFDGTRTSYNMGDYEGTVLTGTRQNMTSLILERQHLELRAGNKQTVFVKRSLVDGVAAWSDQTYRYLKVPPALVGATFFSGPQEGPPAGNMTLLTPRHGTAYIWAEEALKDGPQILLDPAQVHRKLHWEEVGDMPFETANEGERFMRVFKTDVFPSQPLIFPVSDSWVGGVAFRATEPVDGSANDEYGDLDISLGSPPNASAIEPEATFDGVELIDGRECNKFTFLEGAAAVTLLMSVELWFSPEDNTVCRIRLVPWVENPSGAGSATIDVPGFSPKFFPGVARLSRPQLPEAPSGWRCQAASAVGQPWLWLAPTPEAALHQGNVLTAATALALLVKATGAVGLLPEPLFRTLVRLVVVPPVPSSEQSRAAAPAQPPAPLDAPGAVPAAPLGAREAPAPAAPATAASATPQVPPLGIFGADLRTFSFAFTSSSGDNDPAAAPQATAVPLGGTHHGSGELRVDLARRRLYLNMEGKNVSEGIPYVQSKILLQGDKGRLHVQTKIRAGAGNEDFEQCWKVNTKESLPALLQGEQPNPFLNLKARRIAAGAGFAGTIYVGQSKSVELFVDEAKWLRSFSVLDRQHSTITSVMVRDWSTAPIDSSWFETGQGWDCQDLSFLEGGAALEAWDLLNVLFPAPLPEPLPVLGVALPPQRALFA